MDTRREGKNRDANRDRRDSVDRERSERSRRRDASTKEAESRESRKSFECSSAREERDRVDKGESSRDDNDSLDGYQSRDVLADDIQPREEVGDRKYQRDSADNSGRASRDTSPVLDFTVHKKTSLREDPEYEDLDYEEDHEDETGAAVIIEDLTENGEAGSTHHDDQEHDDEEDRPATRRRSLSERLGPRIQQSDKGIFARISRRTDGDQDAIHLASERSRRRDDRLDDTCRHCHRPGHSKESCPKLRCELCGTQGHHKNDCKQSSRQSQRQRSRENGDDRGEGFHESDRKRKKSKKSSRSKHKSKKSRRD